MPKNRESSPEAVKEREIERKRQMRLCSLDVSILTKKMLEGKDRDRIASAMNVAPSTLYDKVRRGRFSAAELYYLAGLCGYRIEGKEKLPIEGMLES